MGLVHIAMGCAHAALGHTAQARTNLLRGVQVLDGNFIPGSTLDMSFLARAHETLAEMGNDGSG